MTKQDLFRRYDAIRCTDDRRKMDALIEEVGQILEEIRLVGRIPKPSCPPHLVMNDQKNCLFCKTPIT